LVTEPLARTLNIKKATAQAFWRNTSTKRCGAKEESGGRSVNKRFLLRRLVVGQVNELGLTQFLRKFSHYQRAHSVGKRFSIRLTMECQAVCPENIGQVLQFAQDRGFFAINWPASAPGSPTARRIAWCAA